MITTQEQLNTTASISTAPAGRPDKKRELSALDQSAAKNAYDLYKKSGMTQQELADKIEWTQGNLSQYLTGAVPIGKKALSKLCEALGCQAGDIRSEYRYDNNNMALVDAKNRIGQLENALHEALSFIRKFKGESEANHPKFDADVTEDRQFGN